MKKRQNKVLLPGLLILALLLLLVEGLERQAPIGEEPPSSETEAETPGEPPMLEHILLPTTPPDLSSDKYMFRGAWLTALRNLDFPPRPDMTEEELVEAYRQVLDLYELHQLNAVIFQVRPAGDALYPSDLSPLSPYLATSGEAPGFDLLAHMVEATHQRGMEFHAWFNPFRVTVDPAPEKTTQEILAALPEKSHARRHPNQVLRFQDRLFLDPGHPDARQSVIDAILEVVRRYDIDAVHLDDYFYPYPVWVQGDAGETTRVRFGDALEDQATIDAFATPFEDVAAWRRRNVTTFLRDLGTAIRGEKSWVRLGVSPFGIWGHAVETGGLGSDTPVTSMETYQHAVFADSRRWVKEGLLDYIMPQIYWNLEEPQAPYEVLAAWWADTVAGTDVALYIGHALYKVYDSRESPHWQGENPILDQLRFNETLPAVRGSAFFRFRHLLPNHPDFQGDPEGLAALQRASLALRQTFAHPAVIPPMDHIVFPPPAPPTAVVRAGDLFTFQDGFEDGDGTAPTRYFLVYALPVDNLDTQDPAHLYKRIPKDPGKTTYTLVVPPDHQNHVFAVSAVSRMHGESPAVACIRPE